MATSDQLSAGGALSAVVAGLAAGPVEAYGLRGSMVAFCAAALRERAGRPLVVLVQEEARAAELVRDLAFFLGADGGDDPGRTHVRASHLPEVEHSPYADLAPDRRQIMRRLAVLFRLAHGMAGEVVVLSARSLARRTLPPDALKKRCDLVLAEEELDRAKFLENLTRAGFMRQAVCEDPGTFAVRGGVIDVFVPLYRYPARIEFYGDLVEHVRFFDPSTQRTLRPLTELLVHPVRETLVTEGADPRARLLEAGDVAGHPSSRTRALIEQVESGEDFFGREALIPAFHARMAGVSEYLPPDAVWLVEEPDEVLAEVRREEVRLAEGFEHRRVEHRIAFAPSAFTVGEDEVRSALASRAQVALRTLELEPSPGQAAPVRVRFDVQGNGELAAELRRARAERGEQMLGPLVSRLREVPRSAIVVPNGSHAERLSGLLRGYGLEPRRVPAGRALSLGGEPGVEIWIGPLAEGFSLPDEGFQLFAEDEVFGPRAHRRATKEQKGGLAFEDFRQLQPGDPIVHKEHGVGRYMGLVRLAAGGVPADFLHLEYDGGKLYVPVYRLSQVQRWMGAEGERARMDRLGGQTWQLAKKRVRAEVRQLAEDLLKLYAQRAALPGHAMRAPDAMFREFEATFPFEETPDQQRAIDEVLGDMEADRPMDRLVCGDVGYGKTEVALRAAFLAAENGRQVAFLAPTTVLAQQHYSTCTERFRDYPVRVGVLSRFQSKEEQSKTVKAFAEGKVDVLVGTHRLLSKDVRWNKLGLLIIDEEQRFGVAHKERIKQMRTQVDVLTLTATPIPRTMHMSLMGLREISIIATPPADRLAIRTFVCKWEDSVLREAIKRELARGGQLFFVHNRVEDIEHWAERLRALVPELRVAIGHGQMEEGKLERVMIDFIDHKSDVLLCTTIIESGLDIPRANTMIVNRADCFGLAQLYQLRGRIGRGRERAFCYLLVPGGQGAGDDVPLADDDLAKKKQGAKVRGAMTVEAQQRLAVLQRFTELGSGFLIAQHDLEIRGAGELLGGKQSGTIGQVGFETYTEILREAIAELRGESIRPERDPELTADLAAFIPDDYVPDTAQRLDLYRRLASAVDGDDVTALVTELEDRFGAAPVEVRALAGLMEVKALARKLRATAIDVSASKVQLALADDTPLSPERVLALVQKRGSPFRLTPDMRLVRALSEEEKKDRLAAARTILHEILACAN